ncbi:hypothetical protein NEMBOFW57_004684 [Staphylotrichum longicolle]|uniref:Integral membrane protein n=1 Tax=Staphylotrichum longicolle TaxID=669026 RepID=A0AAD4FC55_9PEZI|nr:hypothetical protein NEMBOFW57_004684 [Staphylotrichum longicolle]
MNVIYFLPTRPRAAGESSFNTSNTGGTSGPPAMPPDVLVSLPHDNAGPKLNAVFWTLSAISGLFVLARFCAKRLRRRAYWWDDWLLVASWIVNLAAVCIISYCISLGLGRHMWDVDPAHFVPLFQAFNVTATMSIVASIWSKTSFALTILRLTDGWLRVVVWFLIGSTNVAMGVTALINWVRCTPVQKLWDYSVEGSCWPVHVVLNYDMFSAVVDISLVAVAWKLLLGLHMDTVEKIGATIAMSMGVFAGATSFVKTAQLWGMLSPDLSAPVLSTPGNISFAHMRLSSIAALAACFAVRVDAALTTVEFDLMFPRANVSYTPTTYMPIIFAVKNPQPAKYMRPVLAVEVSYPNGTIHSLPYISSEDAWGNAAANETTFYYTIFEGESYGFNGEGSWPLKFHVSWMTCAEGPNGGGEGDSDTGHRGTASHSMLFRTARDGQAISLLSAGADTECHGLPGFRITTDDTVRPVVDPSTATAGIHQCVTAAGSELVSDSSCSVKLPAGLVEEVSLSLSAAACADPYNCPARTSLVALASQTSTRTAAATHTGTTGQPAAATTAVTTTAASDPAKNAAERRTMAGMEGRLAAAFGVFGLLLA